MGNVPCGGLHMNEDKFGDKYELFEGEDNVIGKGAFGVIRLGIRKGMPSEKVAVKMIKIGGLSNSDKQALRHEVKIMRSMNHPHIVRLLDDYEDENYVYMILEYLEGGDLIHQLMKKDHFNEKQARDVIVKILSALAYCHERNIVHRDVKPDNILLPSLDSADAELKLSDFGLATQSHGLNLCCMCGSPMYLAPEMVKGEKYGKPVDMWALGVTVYVLLCGSFPFESSGLDDWKQMFKRIAYGEVTFEDECWESVSDMAKEFIRGLLEKDPWKRLTAKKALQHKWIVAPSKSLAKRNLEKNLELFKERTESRRNIIVETMSRRNFNGLSLSNKSASYPTDHALRWEMYHSKYCSCRACRPVGQDISHHAEGGLDSDTAVDSFGSKSASSAKLSAPVMLHATSEVLGVLGGSERRLKFHVLDKDGSMKRVVIKNRMASRAQLFALHFMQRKKKAETGTEAVTVAKEQKIYEGTGNKASKATASCTTTGTARESENRKIETVCYDDGEHVNNMSSAFESLY